MNEFNDTIILAHKVLDRNWTDPDCDLTMLARQFLRSREHIQHLQSLMACAADALEGATKMIRTNSESDLISELRKAAE